MTDKMYAIPKEIFDDVKYGNPGNWTATLTRGNTDYCLELKHRQVVCNVWIGIQSMRIPLHKVPPSVESDWVVAVDHEC